MLGGGHDVPVAGRSRKSLKQLQALRKPIAGIDRTLSLVLSLVGMTVALEVLQMATSVEESMFDGKSSFDGLSGLQTHELLTIERMRLLGHHMAVYVFCQYSSDNYRTAPSPCISKGQVINSFTYTCMLGA